jgi:general stress protein 26
MRSRRHEAMGHSHRIDDDHQELWEKIGDVRVAMMTTVDADGTLRSRPMWTQGDDFDGRLWFFISNAAPAAQALARDGRVELSYAAPDRDLYDSVVGRGELVEDKEKARELWNTFAEAWFPGGVDDPHLELLRVDVDEAEYWEDKKPKVLQFAEIVLGAVTGKPPKSGEKKELDLDEA